MKKKTEAERNSELQRLVDEQSSDMTAEILFPEIVTPLHPKMLEVLTNKEKVSIILSVIGKMSYREIAEIMHCTHTSVSRYIASSYDKLRENTLHPSSL